MAGQGGGGHAVKQSQCANGKQMVQYAACFLALRDALRHPEQFNAQMQRVNEHLQAIGQRVASASRALWDSVTLQEQRGQYLARVRRQYMDYDRDAPQRQVSAASLALIREYEDRER